MSGNEYSRSFKTIWRNLKRALTSSPDIQNNDISEENGNINTSNVSSTEVETAGYVAEQSLSSTNNSLSSNAKRQKLNIATDQLGTSEEVSFIEIMKNLLSCSICLEVGSYSNQCPNGHLICITCSGKLHQVSGDLNCPVCRVSLRQGLHRSLLAEQLTSELPACCRYCTKVMPVKNIKRHETEECTKRNVPCKYRVFGCDWTGIEESLTDHVDSCSIADKSVALLHSTVSENINKDIQLLQIPIQIWKGIIGKIRNQAVGSRIMLRQTTLNKMVADNDDEALFKSPIIRVPFSCCNLHGFYLELTVKKVKLDNDTFERFHYVLKSENKTKIFLNYFISSFKVDELLSLEVNDNLHSHYFESGHKDSQTHDFKLISVECDKMMPPISELDNIMMEVCFISERERSERSHGILNSNEDEETNTYHTNATDSNVVFTLFSPTPPGPRSVNTSNAVLNANEDANTLGEIEPSHEEDIIITVTDNVDSADDISTENRDNYMARNNHSFVALPTVFFNPTPSMLTYSPYPIDANTLSNTGFVQQQQQSLVSRPTQNLESEMVNPHIIVESTEQNHLQQQQQQQQPLNNQVNFNRSVNPRVGESVQAVNDFSRNVRDSLQMSLFYPQQTIVTPYLSNSVSPLAVRPTLPRNIVVRPRHNNTISSTNSQIIPRQSRSVNAAEENVLSNVELVGDSNGQTAAAPAAAAAHQMHSSVVQSPLSLPPPLPSAAATAPLSPLSTQSDHPVDSNYIPYILNQSINLQNSNLPDDNDN